MIVCKDNNINFVADRVCESFFNSDVEISSLHRRHEKNQTTKRNYSFFYRPTADKFQRRLSIAHRSHETHNFREKPIIKTVDIRSTVDSVFMF